MPALPSLAQLGGCFFIVGNDASVQSNVADLTDSCGECVFHRDKLGIPVVGILLRGYHGGDIQQRRILGGFCVLPDEKPRVLR